MIIPSRIGNSGAGENGVSLLGAVGCRSLGGGASPAALRVWGRCSWGRCGVPDAIHSAVTTWGAAVGDGGVTALGTRRGGLHSPPLSREGAGGLPHSCCSCPGDEQAG